VQRNQPAYAERTVPELLTQLSSDTITLVRQELDLARLELAETARRAGQPAGFLGTSALFGLLASGALTACIIAALGLAIPVWTAALVVGIAYAIVAAIAALTAKSRLQRLGAPVPQTTQSVRDSVDGVRQAAERGRNQ